MRSALAGIALTLALGSAGCASSPTALPHASSTTTSRPNRATTAACAEANTVILHSTAAFSDAMARAVAAGERGDVRTRDAAMAELRATFTKWSADLRSTAAKADDPQLAATLDVYAGAVDAAIARVRTFDDLDRLYTFDDQELDVVSSQFRDACP